MSEAVSGSVDAAVTDHGSAPKAGPWQRRPFATSWRGKLFDRTFVLLIGIAVGVWVGYAFRVGDMAPAPSPTKSPPSVAATAKALTAPTTRAADADSPPAQAVASYSASPPLLHSLATGAPVRIGVFGDSFGDGVWAALYHRFPRASGYEVVKYSQQSTGFTRYQQLNLEDRLKAQLAATPVDIAVINFGANDTQGLLDGGHVYGLLTPAWRKTYGDRAERFVEILRNHGVAVYWMGLPKMRKPAYDQDVEGLSDTIRERMAAIGVPYIPIKSLSVDGTGAYNDYLDKPAGGNSLMRAGDGIHMTFAGYDRLADPIAMRIKGLVAYHCATVAAVSADASAASAACTPAGRSGKTLAQ